MRSCEGLFDDKIINEKNYPCQILGRSKKLLPFVLEISCRHILFTSRRRYFRIIENYNEVYPNELYELEFEKLTINSEEESKKLMKFCELPWDKSCLEFYKKKDLVSKTASNIQIREAIYQHSLEKYLPYKKLLEKHGKKYSWFN